MAGAERVRSRNKKIVLDFLSGAGCVDCGTSDWRVLEFDHVESDKTSNVSYLMRTASEARLREEMSKCQIRCKNCHAIKTYERSRSWRHTTYNTGGSDARVPGTMYNQP